MRLPMRADPVRSNMLSSRWSKEGSVPAARSWTSDLAKKAHIQCNLVAVADGTLSHIFQTCQSPGDASNALASKEGGPLDPKSK